MIQLRDYQHKGIQDLKTSFAKGHKNVLFCLPTGGGKTVCFSEITRRTIEKDDTSRVIILTDRIELLSQAGSSLYRAGIQPALLTAGRSGVLPHSRVIVGMVETFYKRLQKGWMVPNLKLIIEDEAHKGNFNKINDFFRDSEVRIIGATATPLATSKKNPLKNYFSDIVVGTDIPELVSLGYLATPTYYAVKASITAKIGSDGDYKIGQLFDDFNKPKMYDGVVLAYKKHAIGKKTIVFCVNIEHTQQTCQKFLDEGYNAKFLVSEDITNIERKNILRWFAETPDAVLVNAGILTTGFDEPTVECIILNRATQSLSLYLQMVGRGARVTPSKNKFVVIDMGNNLDTHKAWEKRRDWRNIFLHPDKPRAKKEEYEIEDTKECPKCEAISHISKKVCENCGYVFSTKQELALGITEEICPEDYFYLFDYDISNMSVKELIKRAELGNKKSGQSYKKSWIVHQLKKRDNPEMWLREYAQEMGYHPRWVTYQMKELAVEI